MNFQNLPKDNFETLIYMQQQNLLANSIKCEHCLIQCEIAIYKKKNSNGFTWKCLTCKRIYSIKRGSFFNNCTHSLQICLQFIYLWSVGVLTLEQIKFELDEHVEMDTLNTWAKAIRHICRKTMLSKLKDKIGGPDRIVDIQNYSFKNGEDKYYVLAGLERNSHNCFMVPFKAFSSDCIISIVTKWLQPLTTLVTPRNKAFMGILNEWDDNELSDPIDEASPSPINFLWGVTLKHLMRHKIDTIIDLELSLMEAMWRMQFCADSFSNILMHISWVYPLNSSPMKL